MDNKNLSPEQSLDLIQQMIKQAKNNPSDNGFHFLWWGVLVILSSIMNYLLLYSGYSSAQASITWAIMPIIGVPVSLYVGHKQSKQEKVKQHNDRFYGLLWIAFGISLFLLIFFAVYHQLSPIPFILILVGMATFASGALLQFRPLMFGGILFWIAAGLTLTVPNDQQLLINAAATGLGYVVPGLLLRKKFKQAHV